MFRLGSPAVPFTLLLAFRSLGLMDLVFRLGSPVVPFILSFGSGFLIK